MAKIKALFNAHTLRPIFTPIHPSMFLEKETHPLRHRFRSKGARLAEDESHCRCIWAFLSPTWLHHYQSGQLDNLTVRKSAVDNLP
jgi:hypothetical protein